MVSEPILQRNIDSMPLTTQHSHICWVCNRPMLLRPAPRLCLRLMPLLPVMHSILDASYVIHSSVRDVVAESAFARRQQLELVGQAGIEVGGRHVVLGRELQYGASHVTRGSGGANVPHRNRTQPHG